MTTPITLKDDHTFLVSDHAGEVLNTPEGSGMYLHDTRYLSRFELLVNGQKPHNLSHTLDYNVACTFHLSAGHFGEMDRGGETTVGLIAHMVSITRRRYIRHGLVETLEFTNYYPSPVQVDVALRLGADFIDMFEVRGMPRPTPGKPVSIDVPGDGSAVVFRTHGDDTSRPHKQRTLLFASNLTPERWDIETDQSSLTGEPAPQIVLHYRLDLQPRAPLVMHLRVTPEPDHAAPVDLLGVSENIEARFREQVAAAKSVFDEWLLRCTRVESDSYMLDGVFRTSALDLRALMQQEPQGLVVTAGLPWYFTLFGRDSLITALQTLSLNPQIAIDTMRALAAYQATDFDDWRDSEPGKILHELRRGDMTIAGETPHSPYYGSVDSTLLFIMLYAAMLDWTGDRALFEELWPNVQRALEWAWNYGDIDGDGYIEFKVRSPRGILHQGWKDSDESIGGTLGPRPTQPLALTEVQGYYYAALTGLARILRRYGNTEQHELASRLDSQAATLKEQFNRDFWWEEEGIFVQALDAQKRPVRSVTSNVGHCLWAGIVDEAKAPVVVSRLLKSDMLSGWGARTMSTTDPTYNPMSYHNGSIWPHDNSLLIAGLRRYGFDEETVMVASEILEAAATFPDYRLPELYCGFPRGEGPFRESAPAAYPVSCSPQAWAAGTSILILQTLLGLQPNSDEGTIEAKPLLPPGVDTLTLLGLRVGAVSFDVTAARDAATGEVTVQKVRR